MKYMLMVYAPTDGDPPPIRDATAAARRHAALRQMLTDDGVLVSAERLAHPVNAKSVRVRDGDTVVTDGPLTTPARPLTACYLVDCDNLDHALHLATRIPEARLGGVEVRPVMDVAGLEM